jgi:hypothetical protein
MTTTKKVFEIAGLFCAVALAAQTVGYMADNNRIQNELVKMNDKQFPKDNYPFRYTSASSGFLKIKTSTLLTSADRMKKCEVDREATHVFGMTAKVNSQIICSPPN